MYVKTDEELTEVQLKNAKVKVKALKSQVKALKSNFLWCIFQGSSDSLY